MNVMYWFLLSDRDCISDTLNLAQENITSVFVYPCAQLNAATTHLNVLGHVDVMSQSVQQRETYIHGQRGD